MLRNVASKVAWVGKTASMVFGLALVLALVLGAAGMVFAADGQPFILGQNNVATALTRLTGNVNGPAMQVQNTNADANDTALTLSVQSGEAPMRVNSTGKVVNLNADKLDGKEPSQIKGARAYALVDPNEGPGGAPILLRNQTSGFTSVERFDTGDYCLTAPGLSSAGNPAVVSVEWYTTSPPEGNAAAMFNSREVCPNGQFTVKTERTILSSGTLTDTEANDVGFIIIVP